MHNTLEKILADTAKSLVPDWEIKMQAVTHYVYITSSDDDSLEEDYHADKEREERMLMAELTAQTLDISEQSTPVPQAY